MSQRLITWFTRAASLLDKSSRFIQWVNTVGMVVFFALVSFNFINVILRYVFNRPIAGHIDITEVGLIILVFFAIAYTQYHRGHVSMDIVINRLSPRQLIVINTIVSLLTMILLTLLIWRTSLNVLHFFDTNYTTRILFIPTFPFAALVPFGCVLVLLLFVRDLFNNVAEGLRQQFSSRLWLLMFGIPILVVVLGILWMQPTLLQLNPLIVGVLGIAVSFMFFLTGMPVVFGLLTVGFLFMAHIRGPNAGLSLMGSVFYTTISDYSFAVIAFFVLMGFLFFFARLGEDVYRAANCWLGHITGGLLQSTIVACTAMGAVVAGTATEIVALAPVALPEMKRYQYSISLAIGSITSSAVIGALIPPSTFCIIYALLTDQSIGKLFVAIIIPGLITALVFMGYVYVRCRLNPNLAPPAEKSGWKDRVVSLKAGGPVVALFLLVIGGLFVGVFTPTEAGAVGAIGAFIIAIIMRRLTWRKFIDALLEAGKMACMAYFLLGAATIFGYLIAASKLTMELGNWVVALHVPGVVTILAIAVVYIILGAIMPAIPMLIITTPIFFPIMLRLGYDPIWFGVFITLLMCLATISPPFGINLFIMKQISKEPIVTIFRGVIPFCVAIIVITALVVVFPSLATWLPSLVD